MRPFRESTDHAPSGVATDTTAEAASTQIEMWRAMSSLHKAEMVTALTVAVQQLCLAGIRMRHPEASERECMLRLAIIKLGRDLAVRVYPEAASIREL